MEDQRKAIDEEEEIVIDIELLLRGMWKSFQKLWYLVVALVIGGACMFTVFWSLYNKPIYECSATFTVATGDGETGSYNFYYDKNTADQMSKTFPYILESSFFQSALKEKMGSDALNGTITSGTISESNVVTMTVESPDAKDARAILDAALEIYPETARFVLGDIQFNMLDEPETPKTPHNYMSLWKRLAIGGGGGLLISLVILGIMGLFRKTARNPEEMKRITSLRCLAAVPRVKFKARKSQRDSRLSVLDERISYGYRESMRALRIRVERSLAEAEGKTLLVTSTAAGEGKSTVAVNLALMLAMEGKKTLLIDGDLRKQGDAALLGFKGKGSLKDIAKGERNLNQLLGKSKKTGLYFLCGSGSAARPAPMLSSQGVKQFIDIAKKSMDYIVIDSPPCGMFQDAGILSEYADGILYVIKHDYAAQRKIREGISSLQGENAVFTGYIFNDYPETAGQYGYGRYGYGYGYNKYGYGTSKDSGKAVSEK